MANPTTNFGWQMPTATDLVTDLPADFEVFGQAVDTDFVDLLGGTTGQVLSKTSNTDLDFTWVNANSSGGYTQLAAGSFSGTSVVLSSISSSYKDLQLVIKGVTWGTGDSYLTLKVNSVTSSTYNFAAAGSVAGFGGFTYGSNDQAIWRFASDAPQTFTSDQNMYVIQFYDYAAANDVKLGSVNFMIPTSAQRPYGGTIGVAGVDAAISSLTISTNAGYTFNGGTYILYGVK